MFQQIMGNLQSGRIQPAWPFINSAVDLPKPFWVNYKIRGRRSYKCFLAVFCSFAIKTVHIKLISDLTSDVFIGALKRFLVKKGRCKEAYCDNATNFVGAKNKLQELTTMIYSNEVRGTIQTTCSTRGINFNFIPPRAPHFGGHTKKWKRLLKQLNSF